MRKDVIKEIILNFHEEGIGEIKPRNVTLPINSQKVITVSGVRRSGKTYILFNVIKQLLKQGVDKTNILYINFEDERLEQKVFDLSELDLIIQSYRELYPDKKLNTCYFFFDEIQIIKGWERFIRRIDDKITKNIFITGSNAKLLGSEIATALRGRPLNYEVYPLSFKEYLMFLKPDLLNSDIHSSREKAEISHYFDKFLYYGGFPELTHLEEQHKQKTLQSYFNVMIFTDLIDRYEIQQSAILKYFCKRLVANSAYEFSVHKLFNEIKSQGYKVSKDTLYQFQDYVGAIYLARFVNKYAQSVVKQEFSQKKSYCIDVGLANALDFKFSKDLPRQLENLIYLELLKAGKEVFYFKNGYECDFLIQEKGEVISLLQVCYDLSDEDTKKREIKGLVETCGKYGLSEGTIVTFEEENEIETEGVKIKILPVQKFILNL